MFYPEESLKRGGRFYLCWVADSWPLRFATITHRQLWSQDIRKICDDLLKVMINESGRPANRFSLRLSSQLLRGLVRLYQKKVTVFLSELCMINANVIKHTNKKWNVCEIALEDENIQHPRLQRIETLPLATIEEVLEVENEGRRIEEIIANSGNVVSNIQDITLKEATIPDIQVPPNDGFGEEHPEQLYQSIVTDRTLEVMLHAEGSIHSSALGPVLDTTESSRKSRLLNEAQMEMITEHDLTMFRKSTMGAELMPAADFEKDIPEIPQPDLPAPEISVSMAQAVEPVAGTSKEYMTDILRQPEPVDIELEELEDAEPQLKRRRIRTRLIIDKKTKLSSDFLRSRIDNNNVELRCEVSADDVIDIRIPPSEYLHRPCHGGAIICNIATEISRLFMRNLGIAPQKPLAERELTEFILERPRQSVTRSVLENINEVEEAPIQVPQGLEVQMEQTEQINISKDVVDQRTSVVERDEDISDFPTQKVITLSQAKRQTDEVHAAGSPKRPRLAGYQSFRRSQPIQAEVQDEILVPTAEADKENIPYDDNIQTQTKSTQRSVTALLQEAGLADIQTHQEVEQHSASVFQRTVRRPPSEGSETPLGSLDRTKVSLGESDQTTDSRRFIREHWGTEGTMVKILRCIKEGVKPLTVRNLIAKGPVMSGYQRLIAAQCFTSILKLKHHGFIRVLKEPDTLEIRDIALGPKLD